jgi:hypothetical protein
MILNNLSHKEKDTPSQKMEEKIEENEKEKENEV